MRAGDEGLRARVGEAIIRELLRCNSEYRAYVLPERQAPRVTLHAAGDGEWFPPGVKHRWTR